jgi:hypothetical protein
MAQDLDLLILEITKLPIVIISGPRSGSTPFAYYIQNIRKDLKYFQEPNQNLGSLTEFSEFSKTSNNYILKIIVGTKEKYPNHIQRMIDNNECFTIGITRNNIIDQISSEYIANTVNRWHYFQNENYDLENINVPINLKRMKFDINAVLFHQTEMCKIKCNLRLVYENIKTFDSNFLITPKPKNFEEIKTCINTLIQEWKNLK